MEQEEFGSMLRGSAFFRHMMAGLLQSAEQAMAIITTAVARQIDAPTLESDLLDLQQQAAVEKPDPARDHILNLIRDSLCAKA